MGEQLVRLVLSFTSLFRFLVCWLITVMRFSGGEVAVANLVLSRLLLLLTFGFGYYCTVVIVKSLLLT